MNASDEIQKPWTTNFTKLLSQEEFSQLKINGFAVGFVKRREEFSTMWDLMEDFLMIICFRAKTLSKDP